MNGIDLIAVERTRQIESEGYSISEDLKKYGNDELLRAAVVYAMPFDIREAELIPCSEGSNHEATIKTFKQLLWPWDEKYWKPSSDRKRDLVKAGALIAAEIDRMLLASSINELLKPCPFCGAGKPFVDDLMWNIGPTQTIRHYRIQCPDCGSTTVSCKSKLEAIEKWNQRIEKEPAAHER